MNTTVGRMNWSVPRQERCARGGTVVPVDPGLRARHAPEEVSRCAASSGRASARQSIDLDAEQDVDPSGPTSGEPDQSPPEVGTSKGRSATDTRLLALALQRVPIPQVTKKEIETRWQAGPDTVRKLLRTCAVDPGGSKSLLIPLTDVLFCEGDPDPLTTWVLASKDQRKILSVDLLSVDEYLAAQPQSRRVTPDVLYRSVRSGTQKSVRIGTLHRFRRSLSAAEDWLAARAVTK